MSRAKCSRGGGAGPEHAGRKGAATGSFLLLPTVPRLELWADCAWTVLGSSAMGFPLFGWGLGAPGGL